MIKGKTLVSAEYLRSLVFLNTVQDEFKVRMNTIDGVNFSFNLYNKSGSINTAYNTE